MPFIARTEVVRRLRAQAATGKPIVGCGAAPGSRPRWPEAGGCDLIIHLQLGGRYRMAGRGSLAGLLAYGDANGIVVGDGLSSSPGRPRTYPFSRASTA